METGPFDVKARADRFATCDEIRAALASLPDFCLGSSPDSPWEVDSDSGGRVLIETGESEELALLERLDTAPN
jgi:hypothetical protein